MEDREEDAATEGRSLAAPEVLHTVRRYGYLTYLKPDVVTTLPG